MIQKSTTVYKRRIYCQFPIIYTHIYRYFLIIKHKFTQIRSNFMALRSVREMKPTTL